MNIRRMCSCCGKEYIVDMPEDAYDKWQAGELIQNAWPGSTPAEREKMISGLCDECQIETFGGDD